MFEETTNWDVFLEPGKGYFYNFVPQKGFCLIPVGYEEDNEFDAKIRYVSGDNKDAKEGYLLLANSPGRELKSPFFIQGEPLFQSFSQLSSDEEILAFANIYGELVTRPFHTSFWLREATIELESIDFWKKEIFLMRKMIEMVGCYENNCTADRFMRREKGQWYYYDLSFEPGGKTWEVFVPEKNPESRSLLFYGITEFLNTRLRKYPSSLGYRIENGRVHSYLMPKSLAAALWLQFSQSFFRDGPENMIAHRCFICGRYDKKDGDNMRQRKKDPFKGLWYHETCKSTFYNHQRRERQAEEEGRTIRKHSGRKTLVVKSLDGSIKD